MTEEEYQELISWGVDVTREEVMGEGGQQRRAARKARRKARRAQRRAKRQARRGNGALAAGAVKAADINEEIVRRRAEQEAAQQKEYVRIPGAPRGAFTAASLPTATAAAGAAPAETWVQKNAHLLILGGAALWLLSRKPKKGNGK